METPQNQEQPKSDEGPEYLADLIDLMAGTARTQTALILKDAGGQVPSELTEALSQAREDMHRLSNRLDDIHEKVRSSKGSVDSIS
jgi:hypothetical protein